MSGPLLSFTRALWHGAELVLTSKEAPEVRDVEESLEFLTRIEIQYRETLPDGAPLINLASARWALRSIYQVAQLLVFRELGADLARTELSRPCPESISSSVCYSVDLSFRFLPELIRLTKAISSRDPLLDVLRALAAEWPLSSVGVIAHSTALITAGQAALITTPLPVSMKQLATPAMTAAIKAILENTCLRTLYMDRILATGDTSRLNHPEVVEEVRIALGGFRELSPVIYDLVWSQAVPSRIPVL